MEEIREDKEEQFDFEHPTGECGPDDPNDVVKLMKTPKELEEKNIKASPNGRWVNHKDILRITGEEEEDEEEEDEEEDKEMTEDDWRKVWFVEQIKACLTGGKSIDFEEWIKDPYLSM
jgi:hypothetical protein